MTVSKAILNVIHKFACHLLPIETIGLRVFTVESTAADDSSLISHEFHRYFSQGINMSRNFRL